MMKKFLALALALVMVLALAACGQTAAPAAPAATAAPAADAAPAAEVIKIGYVSDLTGGTSLWGNAGKYGAEMAVEEINAAGGVLGGKMLDLVAMHANV